MRLSIVLLLVFFGCMKTPDVPSTPPKTDHHRFEGLKATAKCLNLPKEDRVSVSARLVESEEGPMLHFRLINLSNQPLRLYRFLLPWGNANAIELAAVGTNGEIHQVSWLIDDPPPESPFTLAPGESVEGEASLDYRIQDLATARATCDIIVTWCYGFAVVGEQRSGQVTGTVVIPKRAI